MKTLLTKNNALLAQQITAARGSTYFWAIKLLPKHVRADVFTLYAFVRVFDDAVDESETKQAAETAFQALLTEYEADLEKTTDKIIKNYKKLEKKYDFPPNWTQAFFKSMQWDISKTNYDETELETYIFGSATVVGFMMSKILGVTDENWAAAAPHMASLAWAMQMTNFLRDVGEDYADRGRIYLKMVLDEKSLVTKTISEPEKAHLKSLAQKIDEKYDHALSGVYFLPSGRAAVRASAFLYRGYLKKIQKSEYALFTADFSLSKREKALLVLKSFLKKS